MASRRKRAARFLHSRAAGIRSRTTQGAAGDTPDTAAGLQDSDTDGSPPSDELESGIAEIFAAIRAADDEAAGNDGSVDDEDAGEPRHIGDADDAVTYRLLGELERLWQRAA